jgi:hypothetical protein
MEIGDKVHARGRGDGKYIGRVGDYVYVRLASGKLTRVRMRIVQPIPDEEAA